VGVIAATVIEIQVSQLKRNALIVVTTTTTGTVRKRLGVMNSGDGSETYTIRIGESFGLIQKETTTDRF
jgi:hypothetical protein